MLKRLTFVLILLLGFTVVVSADPYGFTRGELEFNDRLIEDKLQYGDGINPVTVEQIIRAKQTFAEIRNTWSKDAYIFYFNQPYPGEIGSFCVGAQNGDDAYVAFYSDDPGTTLGIKILIDGQVEVRFYDGMTFQDMFIAVRNALQSVCNYPVHDTWVFMTLKMLLELMRMIYP